MMWNAARTTAVIMIADLQDEMVDRDSPPPPPLEEFDGGYEAFIHELRSIRWPEKFKVGPI